MLVVGAGPIATRKVEGLLAEGAVVRVVAPDVCAEMAALTTGHPDTLRVETRGYETGDLVGSWLVITATNSRDVQQRVFDDGERLGVWVNAADDPDRCAFILPAVHRDGPVTVAVSTGGASPALAQWLRNRIRAVIPANVASMAEALAARRAQVKASGGSTESMDWFPAIEELAVAAVEPVDAEAVDAEAADAEAGDAEAGDAEALDVEAMER